MQPILKNNRLYDDTQVALPHGPGLIYEVIRIIGGAALFFQEHYDRFLRSAQGRGAGLPSADDCLAMMETLIGAVDRSDFNIKIILDPAGGDLYLFESPSAYPAPSLYRTGVHTELMSYHRSDPNAKIINTHLTDLAQSLRQETGAYELLLVDPAGRVTEGARSNLFFVRQGELVTPPLDSVLPGVTRQRVIAAAQDLGIVVREEAIEANELDRFDAAFLTGTSPRILPIASIGALSLASGGHPLVKELIQRFDQVIQTDLSSYRQRVKDRSGNGHR